MSEAPIPTSAPASLANQVVSRQEKIEYRDQDGNLLDEAAVKELEGKVSFKTRYETRTRMVDEFGNDIVPAEDAGVAPPHPDVEGADQETVGVSLGDSDKPMSAGDVRADELKEESVERAATGVAKPASEGNDATA